MGQTFVKKFTLKSLKSETKLKSLNFRILSLRRKFEMGQKFVKNHGLTPLLLGEIFRLRNITLKPL